MPSNPDIAFVASLVGEPTRGRMLTALMDGEAHTATELALEGGVTAGTASIHLARLSDAGLVTVERRGRHRYFRVAGPEVASAIEGLMTIAPRRQASRPGAPVVDPVRRARVCYDHLAGEAGVRLLERLRSQRIVAGTDAALALTPRGTDWCEEFGIDLVALRARRRRLCRACLDWTERRSHLAGAIGAAILARLLALRWARREKGSRVVILTRRGEAFIEHPTWPR